MDPISRCNIIQEIERTAITSCFRVFLLTKTGERKMIFESSCENLARVAYLLAFVCHYGNRINFNVSSELWSLLNSLNANYSNTNNNDVIQNILKNFGYLSDDWKNNFNYIFTSN